MRSLLQKQWFTVAVLASMLFVLVGLVAPADAATARSVGIKASPSAAYAGSRVRFSGKVTHSPKGSSITIQRLSGSVWKAVTSTRTSTTGGAYSVTASLPGAPAAYSYRAVAPKTSRLNGATSPIVKVTALRHTAATIAASPSTISQGGSSSLGGAVAPFLPGTVVVIQRLSGSTWVPAGTRALSFSGTFNLPVSPTSTTAYRVSVPRTGIDASTTSAPTTVTVSVPDAPKITTSSLPDATRDVAYTTTLTKTGGAGSWSVLGLPAGLSLNSATGVISGVAKVSGTYGVYPTFTETSSGLKDSVALALHVVGAQLAVTTTSLPDAAKGAPYTVTLTKTGGAGTWASYPLPAGLSLDPATGVISGTPTDSGNFGVYVVYTESASGAYATGSFALHISAPKINAATLPDGVTGTAYPDQQLTQSGGGPGTWSLDSGALPDGLALSDAGLISGTPTTAGDYLFYVTYTETATGTTDTTGFYIHVSDPGAPVINTTTLPQGTVGVAYSATLSAVGTGTWEPAYGAFPDGLSLNTATGEISGTPTTPGDSYFIVRFTTADGTNTKALTIHINPAP